jgi:hypothetical protein
MNLALVLVFKALQIVMMQVRSFDKIKKKSSQKPTEPI